MNRAVLSLFSLLITLFLGIFIFLPKAEAACTTNPTWQFIGWTGGVRSVTYHLRLINNCSGTNTFNIRVSKYPTSPQEFNGFYRVEQENGTLGPRDTVIERTVTGSENIDIMVIRDIDYFHRDGVYQWVTFRAALKSNTSINDTLDYTYIVQNAPDLSVTRFEFPGGPECKTTDAIVRFRNVGWKEFSGDFDVRVYNGNNNNGRTFRVTQFIEAREFVNLDARFTDMNRPFPNTWEARLVLDLQNEIREENENPNDNEAKFVYETTPCITPTVTQPPATSTPTPTRVPGTTITPTPSPIPGATNTPTPTTIPGATNTPTPTPTPVSGDYFIKGGVYIDENLSRTKNGEETYIAGSITVRNINTGVSLNTTSAEGTGFTSVLLPAGRYSITYIAPEDTVVTYPTITPPTITMNLGPSCIDETPDGDPTCDPSGNIINVNFGIEPIELIPDPWIKGIGGDMRVDNGMENIIPDSSSYFSENYNSIYDKMDHGIVFGDSNLKLGDSTIEKANTSQWFADVPFSFPKVNTKYSEMWNTLYKGGILTENDNFFRDACVPGGFPPDCELKTGLPGGVYSAGENQNVTITNTSSYNFLSGQDYIFLIKKDLVIKTNLIVPPGATVLFIVEGDIIVAPNVSKIEGIYSTDNNFIVKSACDVCGEFDIPLYINGSVIANANQELEEIGDFINERDLGSQNAITPAVTFKYRPDFVLNMPQLLRYKSYSIKEIAPGAEK
jgi:hypothetical protein